MRRDRGTRMPHWPDFIPAVPRRWASGMSRSATRRTAIPTIDFPRVVNPHYTDVARRGTPVARRGTHVARRSPIVARRGTHVARRSWWTQWSWCIVRGVYRRREWWSAWSWVTSWVDNPCIRRHEIWCWIHQLCRDYTPLQFRRFPRRDWRDGLEAGILSCREPIFISLE